MTFKRISELEPCLNIDKESLIQTKKEVIDENEQIEKVIKLTSELWSEILKLEIIHSSDNLETQRDIHNIQNRIMARKYQIEKYKS